MLGKDEYDAFYKFLVFFVDVYEGVKIVVKMVKWLFTSFYIRIKNLIVVFDVCVEKDVDEEGF